MAQLHLPAEHSDADLVMAGLIAEQIDSAELYVVWTPEGPAVPEVVAELRMAAPHWTATLGFVLQAVRELFAAFRGGNRPHELQPAAGHPAPQPGPAA